MRRVVVTGMGAITISSTDFFCSSDKTFVISVSIYPGATALTVIPRDASSFAADLKRKILTEL